MLTPAQIDDIKQRHPVDSIAGRWVTLRRRGGLGNYAGPCPLCSDDPQSRTAARFEVIGSVKWVCAVCNEGGDVIALVRLREGLTFNAAVEWLGGPQAIDPAKEKAIADQRAADQAKKSRAEFDYRERERVRLWDKFWNAAGRLGRDTPADRYLQRRGLYLPPGAHLRHHPNAPLFADGREKEPRLLHTGDAMLAAITRADEKFAGVHFTWLDLATPKGKAAIQDPETGELLPAKKSRGSKKGGYIDLGCCPADSATRMIAGEGIETVLSVYTAMRRAGRDLTYTNFRCAIDLGNLAGRALENIKHPTETMSIAREGKEPYQRARTVPGPEPDLESPAMPVPDNITDLVLLGDGDSDPFLTRNALQRAAARNAREHRRVRIRFAPDGMDFNDVLTAPGLKETET